MPITLDEGLESDEGSGMTSADDSMIDWTMLLDRRPIANGFWLEVDDSFGVEEAVIFVLTGVVFKLDLAGDFFGVTAFFGDGDFSLAEASNWASSLA